MSLEDTLSSLNINVDAALGKLRNKAELSSVAVSRTVASVYPGDSLEFKIANYDSEIEYAVATAIGNATLSVTGESASELSAVVHYTAPGTPGNEVLQINERQIQFPVLERVVVKPDVVAPVDGSGNVSLTPTVTGTAFDSTPVGYDSHQSTDWQIATDSGFSNVVWQSMADTVNLETITLPGGQLSGGATYYVRLRYVGATLGASEWSDAVSFTTAATFLSGVEVAKLVAADGASTDEFGYSVALSGDGNTAIIGTRYEDAAATANGGAAYIFVRNGSNVWSQQAKLIAPDGASSDFFGYAVDISSDGDTVIIGAYGVDYPTANAGAAYIFTRAGSTWSQQAKLQDSGAGAGQWEGYSVTISADGNTAVTGARYGDYGTNSAGGAFVYVRNGSSWSQQVKLYAADIVSSDGFGASVAISGDGDTLLCGAPYKDATGIDSGAAYIFTRSGATWDSGIQLLPPDVLAYDQFGYNVAVSGDGGTLAIGARYKNVGASADAGQTYIYARDGANWVHQSSLTPPGSGDDGRSGTAVALSHDGNLVLIGAPNSPISGQRYGAVFFYKRTGTSWATYGDKITASDRRSNDQYGWAVTLSDAGDIALVGAFWDDDAGADSGSVYVLN